MPPRIRTRASKALKENIDVTANKSKLVKNTSKAPRKALADKTNSASDDASLEIPTKSKTQKTVIKTSKTGSNKNEDQKPAVEMKQKRTVKPKENVEPAKEVRSRRDRRLPNRFVENIVLNNLTNSKESVNVTLNSSPAIPKADNTPQKKESLSKTDKSEPSPFKTPSKVDSSLIASRPRRICRLPSRFEDHSISPNKYIPIQPANASTPIQQTKTKLVELNDKENVSKNVGKKPEKKQVTARPARLAKINALQKEASDNSSEKSSPDTNNNAKGRTSRKKITKTQPPTKKPSPVKKTQSPIRKFLTPMSRFSFFGNKTQSPTKRVSPEQLSSNKKPDSPNLSFKLLGSKKTSQKKDKNEQDIYEFTFDPGEEPKPQKKTRKRTVTKKPAPAPAPKPKKTVYKSRYDQNISKAMAALKNAVTSTKAGETAKLTQITEISDAVEENVAQSNVASNVNTVQTTNVAKENSRAFNDTGKNSVHECNYPSIRVEDIAADIEPSMDHHDDINYSPINSPRPNILRTSSIHEPVRETRSVHNGDPLNLIEELSFFDEQPVASSSMNMSVRHPLASPWRVEFGSLPIKWPNNTYVKPNMTPAVETSFINPEDSMKKKHVYTNMLPETNEMFTDVADTPNLKQPSIISFMKEMAEKSAKKKRGRSVSPTKANYQDIMEINAEVNTNKKSTKKATENKSAPTSNNTSEEVSSSANEASTDKENSKEERKARKRKNNENVCNLPAKSPRKQKDKDQTFFGFDESENQDENVSPIKVNNNPIKGRSLRTRSKAVLQEINGPTRAVLPAKTKIATSTEAVNKVYQLKSGADAPVFPEKNVEDNATNMEELEINDDSQSVHLFEDIEVVHHVKPTRKSYGKSKKVTFRQRSTSDSETEEPVVADPNESSDYDDLGDLTFEIANVPEKKVAKKKKPKKQRTKKEEKEAEAWAANFNSMCEDIEEFPLIVE